MEYDLSLSSSKITKYNNLTLPPISKFAVSSTDVAPAGWNYIYINNNPMGIIVSKTPVANRYVSDIEKLDGDKGYISNNSFMNWNADANGNNIYSFYNLDEANKMKNIVQGLTRVNSALFMYYLKVNDNGKITYYSSTPVDNKTIPDFGFLKVAGTAINNVPFYIADATITDAIKKIENPTYVPSAPSPSPSAPSPSPSAPSPSAPSPSPSAPSTSETPAAPPQSDSQQEQPSPDKSIPQKSNINYLYLIFMIFIIITVYVYISKSKKKIIQDI